MFIFMILILIRLIFLLFFPAEQLFLQYFKDFNQLHALVSMKKKYPENFRKLKTLELFTCKLCEMFVYKYIETIKYAQK